MKIRIVIISTLLMFFVSSAFSQNNGSGFYGDPDPVGLLSADTVLVNSNMTRKERRAAHERKIVGQLVKRIAEEQKFQFEGWTGYYRGNRFSYETMFGVRFQCYGGRLYNTVPLCPHLYGGGVVVGSGITDFEVSDIKEDKENIYLVHFSVVMNCLANMEGRMYDRFTYEFVVNILNGETALRVYAEDQVPRKGNKEPSRKYCGVFVGYINELR